MIELSIIIPVFNECRKIQRDMEAADHFLISTGLAGEIIIVDDGSTDNTASVANKVAQSLPTPCRIERLDSNSGKGRAVRTGILKSRGRYVLFADSGVCIPYAQTSRGLELIRSGQCQIAHGSRKLSACNIQRPPSFYRKLCSHLFHWFLIHDIKRLGNLTDTQCGFKVYQGDVARDLYAQSTIDGFMFDIEMTLLALSSGYRICEFDVDWTCDRDSRLKPTHEILHVLRDLVRLKKRFGEFLRNN